MESLNSKEKSKKTWQFIFIFFALALLPVAAIFFSCFKMPEALMEEDNLRMGESYKSEEIQKKLINQINTIDSNFSLIAVNYSEYSRLIQKITYTNEEMKKTDGSELIQRLNLMIDNFGGHMRNAADLKSANDDLKANIESLKVQLNARNDMFPQQPSNGG